MDYELGAGGIDAGHPPASFDDCRVRYPFRLLHRLAVPIVAILLASCERLGDKELATARKAAPPFILAVVGDGVRPDPKCRPASVHLPATSRRYEINSSQGRAMAQGACRALETSPYTTRARSLVGIEYFDDGGLEREAEKYADELAENARVISILGHGTSGTTRVAAPFYARAQIPLLMPVATSPSACRLSNFSAGACLRLPPDDSVQAKAVAHAVRKLGKEHAFLVQDGSSGAADYSAYLSEQVRTLVEIPDTRYARLGEPGEAAYWATAQNVRDNADLIIFVGYSSSVRRFLDNLRTVFADVPQAQRPPLLLTDGCFSGLLDPSGFDVFLTFPYRPEPNSKMVLGSEAATLATIVDDTRVRSYQAAGYDAVLVLASALDKCADKGVVSRQCVKDILSSKFDFVGGGETYAFDHGERVHPSYYLLALPPREGYPYEIRWEYLADPSLGNR